jgi:hypothetical protein
VLHRYRPPQPFNVFYAAPKPFKDQFTIATIYNVAIQSERSRIDMYSRYVKTQADGRDHYRFIENICLFGCNEGYIPWLLAEQTPSTQEEPYAWHLDVEAALAKTEFAGSALIIDLKPKQKKSNLSLYELIDVWGYSASDWTPILLHLTGLFVDADPTKFNRKDFWRRDDQKDDPIYEVLYLDGTVSKGKITGKWIAPPASPTNAALLWPETRNYFVNSIKSRSPGLLTCC